MPRFRPQHLLRFGLTGAFMFAGVLAASAQDKQGDGNRVKIEGEFKPTPIAIVPPFGGNDGENALGKRIAAVVANNLRNSGRFSLIDPAAFVQRDESVVVRPRFADWKDLKTEYLVSSRIRYKANGDVRVEFRLWNVIQGSQVIGRALETRPGNWRRLAHKFSDAVYSKITSEGAYFDTRIVYVHESGPATARVKRLAIMDQDGANHRFLTDGSNLVLTPRFSPTSQEVTYLEYIDAKPRVYVLNIDTGRKEIVGDFPGMTFAPRYSPNGNKIVMSMERDGNSEIYVRDLRTRRTTRLTNHQAIDTSPSFSPDGSMVAFNSDRSGRQKIYVMNADGSNVRRISNKPGRYATPVWSPRGDQIAFTRISGGEFSIGVMEVDGANERILSRGFLAEGPTWAPNGRVLMFYKQSRGGSPQLFSIDITGRNEQRVSTPGQASDPAWSPLLKD
jgi:TolB protein